MTRTQAVNWAAYGSGRFMSEKGYWRMAQVLNSIITKKIIAQLGYISMSDYYLTICENYRTAVAFYFYSISI